MGFKVTETTETSIAVLQTNVEHIKDKVDGVSLSLGNITNMLHECESHRSGVISSVKYNKEQIDKLQSTVENSTSVKSKLSDLSISAAVGGVAGGSGLFAILKSLGMLIK